MKHSLLILSLALAAALAAGCAGPGMSAEQMKAMEGSSSSMCIKFPAWNGSLAEVHYASFGGKSTGTAGGGGKAMCGASVVEFINEGRALPPQPQPLPQLLIVPPSK